MDKMENQKTGERQLKADKRELNDQDKARLMLSVLNIIMFAKETLNLFRRSIRNLLRSMNSIATPENQPAAISPPILIN